MTTVTHEYECPKHGRFDKVVPFGESPPKVTLCPGGQGRCLKSSPWVPPTVGVVWNI